MGEHHENQGCQQKRGQQGDGNMVCHEAEKRRDQAGSDVGAGHLHADERLGALRPEGGRRGVDDARVDGRASQPHQQKSRQAEGRGQG